jgi:hypothetical protein
MDIQRKQVFSNNFKQDICPNSSGSKVMVHGVLNPQYLLLLLLLLSLSCTQHPPDLACPTLHVKCIEKEYCILL